MGGGTSNGTNARLMNLTTTATALGVADLHVQEEGYVNVLSKPGSRLLSSRIKELRNERRGGKMSHTIFL